MVFVKELLKEKNVDEIWLIARRKERLEALVENYGYKLRAFVLDLTEMTSFEQLSAVLEKEKPNIAYLVMPQVRVVWEMWKQSIMMPMGLCWISM